MNFSTSLSSLQAAQYAISTGAQNVANANTAGYHRQRVMLTTRQPQWISNLHLGSGVEISRIDRVRSQVLEGFYTQSVSDLSGIRGGLGMLRQIESEFLLGDGSIHQSVSGFFSELTRLSANPNEQVARDAVIFQATQISRQVTGIHNRLVDMRTRIESQIRTDVNTLNQELAELVSLQRQIEINSVQGAAPNELLDRRDILINKLAEKIDINRHEINEGTLSLTIGGSALTINPLAPRFEVAKDDQGKLSIVLQGTDREITFPSGSISALQEVHNTKIPEYMNRLNEFAKTFIREVDQMHAKGVGVNGPFQQLRSSRMVLPTNVPLNDADMAFAVNSGELTVSVTDPQGHKRTHTISINPEVDSLQDIANKLDGIANLRAVVDPLSGQLSVFAQPGYGFDFTGNLETIPGLENFQGTAVPQISGKYVGDKNRNIEVTIVGSGTVGTTDNLIARVTDVESGAVIAELQIGKGYEAGSKLVLKDGVELSFSAGSVEDGDNFRTPLIKESDSTGILSALGLNSFFGGSGARDMSVSSRILDNPNELATSRTGDRADTSNLMGLIGLRNKQVVGELKMSFQDYLGDASSTIGFEVKLQERLELNIRSLNEQYEREINAISGVDLNEELLSINQFQKQYDASIQVIRTIDAMMAELMNIIR